MTPTAPAPAKPAPAKLAAEVVQPLPLSEPAKALLTAQLSVRDYFDAVSGAGLTTDAVRVLAVGLPKPEAVWWGCVCVRQAVPKPWTVAAEAALDAAEKWVRDPNDGNRRDCQAKAEAAGWDTAAGCVAGSAWLSGGSLSPPKLPPVSPREDLTGQMVAGALILASVAEPAKADANMTAFLAVGQKLATGKMKKGEKG